MQRFTLDFLLLFSAPEGAARFLDSSAIVVRIFDNVMMDDARWSFSLNALSKVGKRGRLPSLHFRRKSR
jgi:hypothetical protein